MGFSNAGFSAKFVQLKKNAGDGERDDFDGNDGLAPQGIDEFAFVDDDDDAL